MLAGVVRRQRCTIVVKDRQAYVDSTMAERRTNLEESETVRGSFASCRTRTKRSKRDSLHNRDLPDKKYKR